MVDEGYLSANQVSELLNININNLRQIQFRGNLKWSKREGRKVYYLASEVETYAAKRNARKSKQV
jgi:hypothetical protein